MSLVLTAPDGVAGNRFELVTPQGKQTVVLEQSAGPAPSPSAFYSFTDDFDMSGVQTGTAVSTTGAMIATGKSGGWFFESGGANGSIVTASKSSADHPGVMGMRTAAPAASAFSITARRGSASETAVNQPFLAATKIERYEMIVRVTQTTGIRIHCGFSTSPGSTVPVDAIAFRLDPNILGNSNWWAWVRTASVDNLLVDTGYPANPALFPKFGIKQATLGTFTFEIDGVQVAQLAAGVPTGLINFEFMSRCEILASGGLQVDLDLDWVDFESKALNR